MAPRGSLLALFLELAAQVSAEDDPAPWSWEFWRDHFSKRVPPWHPEFPHPTQDPDDTKRRKIQAAQALWVAYRSVRATERAQWWQSLGGNHAVGRRFASDWLEHEWKTWKLNALFDRILATHDIEPFKMVNENLDGVRLLSQGWVGYVILTIGGSS